MKPRDLSDLALRNLREADYTAAEICEPLSHVNSSGTITATFAC